MNARFKQKWVDGENVVKSSSGCCAQWNSLIFAILSKLQLRKKPSTFIAVSKYRFQLHLSNPTNKIITPHILLIISSLSVK